MKKYTLILNGTLVFLLLLISSFTYAQKVIISGNIKDVNQEPLMGVNIVEVDENGRFVSGTITDFNGNFSMSVTSIEAKIQVSFIGYTKKVLTVGSKKNFNIVLDSESLGLEEIVIRGEKMGNDGVIKVRDRATAVSRIELQDMESVQTTSVEEMLQGRISNVDIVAVSGDPGAGLNIRIRGTATLNANNEPLIVVNGIPYDASVASDFDFASADIEQFGNLIDVSPEDIESIEVLKDAASTAVYGAKAANGVLMIQTKRGKKSKPIFEYTTKFTRATEPDPIPMLNGAGYARLIKEAHFNNNGGTFQSEEIDFDPSWEQYHNFAQNTNWVEEITQIGYIMDHNFSVRGGGDKSRYKMSMSYFDQSGTTKGTGLEKLNISTSLDYDLSTKLRIKTDILFTRYNQDLTYDAEDWNYRNNRVRSTAYRKMPNMSVYELDTLGNVLGEYFTPIQTIQGTADEMYNPVAFATLGTHKKLKDNARAALTIRYNILPGLIYDGTITLDIFDEKRSKFLPFKALGYEYSSNNTNRAFEEYNKKSGVNTLNKLIYTPDFGETHDLVLLALLETESSNSINYNTTTARSASPYLQDPAGVVDLIGFGASSSVYRSIGSYVSANYKYKDKYLVSAGLRYEGNSKFSSDSRYGFFPMTTLAWRISEEPFMKYLGFIDDFKLRGSWGISGNMPDGNYLYFNTYSASTQYGYMGVSGVRPDGIELTSLQWETIEQFSPGLTFFGFNNRVNIEFDIYQKLTRHLYLRGSSIPSTTGYGGLNQNDGEMLNKGWEFMIDAKIIDRKDLKLSMNFNASHNENMVLRLPENYSMVYGDMLNNGNYQVRIEPGVAIGGFFGYEYDGVYVNADDVVVKDKNDNPVYDITGQEKLIMTQGANGYEFEPGDAKYRDQNYDGVIDELDLVNLGDYNPALMGGIGPRLQIKDLTFNFFFYYKLGQDIINQTRMDTEKMYNHDNQSMATNWRWRSPGDETDVPRALYNKGYNWMGSNRFVEDGSYLRLKSASISYNLPSKFCKRMQVRDVRVYGTAYNLFTWTRYSGQDPEVSLSSNPKELPKDRNMTPPGKRITIGLNIKF